MGIMVYSFLGVMQDLYRQPYQGSIVQGPPEAQFLLFLQVVYPARVGFAVRKGFRQ